MADIIDERYIEAFLAIYNCLNENIYKAKELYYQILRDNNLKLNKEIEK